jgi:hypothetical protein
MNEILNTIGVFWQGMPLALRAFLTLVGGLVFAGVMRSFFKLILKIIRFARICNRIGFTEFLRKGGVRSTPIELVSNLIFWAIALVVFLRVSRLLDLLVITQVYNSFINVIPSLIAAVLIIIAGWIILEFFANFTVTVVRNTGFMQADLVGKIIRYLGFLLIIILAVGQIEIGTGVLGSMLLVLFSAVCFGLALAFGLGCKDLAHDIARRLLDDLHEKGRQGKAGDLEG